MRANAARTELFPLEEAAVRYLHVMDTVPGWFSPLDARILTVVDAVQRARAISGDLLEIGVYQGKSAILLGYLMRPNEKLVVCDVFQRQLGLSAENRADVSAGYENELQQETFEHWYLSFHETLPTILAHPSTQIDRKALAQTFRLVHVDGSHAYEVVREDIATARCLLGDGGVVVLDDWSNPLTPGVALAIWDEYLRGDLIPLCFTHSKLYASWDLSGVTPGDLDAWAATQPDVQTTYAYGLGRREARLYSSTSSPLRGMLRQATPPIVLAGYRQFRNRVGRWRARPAPGGRVER